jgi:hypothetical protein
LIGPVAICKRKFSVIRKFLSKSSRKAYKNAGVSFWSYTLGTTLRRAPLKRKPAANSAADAGFSTEQLVDFFGWKNGSMCQEYISSSKPAILGMASRLGGFEALSQDPVVEVEMEKAPEMDIKPMQQDMEEYIVLEEEPEIYAMAGLELVPVPNPVTSDRQGRIESTIRQAMSSVPTVNGATMNFKIVVLNDHNSGNFTF